MSIRAWHADRIIKEVAQKIAPVVSAGAQAAQDSMKASTSNEFYDTGTLNRSITINESGDFGDVPVSANSSELGRGGVNALMKNGKISLFVGSGQFYILYLVKHGYAKVGSRALSAAKRALKI